MWAAGEKPPVRLENASKEIALSAYVQEMGKRDVIHLVASVRDEVLRSISETNEFYDIQIILHDKGQVDKAIGLKNQHELNWRILEEDIVIEIPNIQISEIILIEYQ